MRKILLLTVLFLAGCSGDNEPVQPVEPIVNAGVAIGSGGVYPYGGVGFYRGPVSVFIGF
jgi:hypothetical protein